jgi:hypothetical protein
VLASRRPPKNITTTHSYKARACGRPLVTAIIAVAKFTVALADKKYCASHSRSIARLLALSAETNC